MAKITKIYAREILDSRGNPTVEVDIYAENKMARAAVPSGASTGKHEALELRDGGERFHGKGVLKAVENVNKIIAPAVVGMDCREQEAIDKKMIELDGTENKSKLGANAILGVSLAAARLGAATEGKHLFEYLNSEGRVLPIPGFNIINGGKHAGNDLDIQEYMLYPEGAKNFHEALRMGSEIYHTLKEEIKKKHGKNAINVGDEGGFAPPLSTVREPLELITKAIEDSGYEGKAKIGMDSAASSFYKDGKYIVEKNEMNSGELADMYIDISKTYDIAFFEDPFAEDDWDGFIEFTKRIGDRYEIIGDDILVTNPKRIAEAVKRKACNALLLKVNQIGTLTEAKEAANLATKNGWKIMVSHRSGETTDDFIADLAVAWNTGQIKSGAPARGERVAKYNELLRIEEILGERTVFGKG